MMAKARHKHHRCRAAQGSARVPASRIRRHRKKATGQCRGRATVGRGRGLPSRQRRPLRWLARIRRASRGEILAAPEAEPLRIGEIVDRRGPRGRDIDHAGIGKLVLEAQARPALLRRLGIAALAFRGGGIGHGMAFIEQDHPVEICAQPVDDLVNARFLGAAFFRAQRGIGGEQNASESGMLQPCAKRDKGVTSSRSWPSADQSRCASSRSLSLFDIQSALRRPWHQLSSRIPADWRPLPAPVPSPRKKPRRKRTASAASSGAAEIMSPVSSTVQDPARYAPCASPA